MPHGDKGNGDQIGVIDRPVRTAEMSRLLGEGERRKHETRFPRKKESRFLVLTVEGIHVPDFQNPINPQAGDTRLPKDTTEQMGP